MIKQLSITVLFGCLLFTDLSSRKQNEVFVSLSDSVILAKPSPQQPEIRFGDFGNVNKLNDTAVYNKALKKEKEQFDELLGNYGPLVFVWDDHFGRSDALDGRHGGKLREFYATITQYAHELQPDCLFLGRDVEHVGNEDGRACYPLWNALNTLDSTMYSVSDTYFWNHDNTGYLYGKFYRPQIAPTTDALSSGGWMWTGPRTVQPTDRLLQTYYETVGRGAGLIVNLTPDRRGLIPDNLMAAATAFGDELERRFGDPIAWSESPETEQLIEFQESKLIDHIVLMENLSQGQKIAEYQIEAKINGNWKIIIKGKTIGHKRIELFKPVVASAVRFRVTKTVAENAVMRRIDVFASIDEISTRKLLKKQLYHTD